MPRIVAFSPATANARSALFDVDDDDDRVARQIKLSARPRPVTPKSDRQSGAAAADSIGSLLSDICLDNRQREPDSDEDQHRMEYARSVYPLVFSKRSQCPVEWRRMPRSGLDLSAVYIDLVPPSHAVFTPCTASDLVNQCGIGKCHLQACLEVLPRFYWLMISTPVGLLQAGVVTDRRGFPIVNRGPDVAAQYLLDLPRKARRQANLTSVVLLLMTLQGLPERISARTAISHPGSSIQHDPFRVVLCQASSAVPMQYFFTGPHLAKDRRLRTLPDQVDRRLQCQSASSPEDLVAVMSIDEGRRTCIWVSNP
ncbi:unnamed protein product (mitochondrion) [Plasmodiophora brassicae]|uniref:Uncharacterized protein n=1 Tax=Plasmodiophora brassicae TaxID=37360 RepID=A0A0G4J7Z3_PLABS|nr:hypothetical protein PBRA_009492 [Plasmodiophora brassicae]SPQ94393.1 unnamed protein product [Plasmodiophora brassicae]